MRNIVAKGNARNDRLSVKEIEKILALNIFCNKYSFGAPIDRTISGTMDTVFVPRAERSTLFAFDHQNNPHHFRVINKVFLAISMRSTDDHQKVLVAYF